MTDPVHLNPRASEDRWTESLGRLSGSDIRVAIVVTGGGSGAISRCFRREGASRSFVEAVIPYSHAALLDYMGRALEDSSTSPATARTLATIARKRARVFTDPGDESDERDSGSWAGIALVAALPTSRLRRGEDRIHVALRSDNESTVWTVHLAKEAHTRDSAETVADEMMLRALSELVGAEANDGFFERAGVQLQCERDEA